MQAKNTLEISGKLSDYRLFELLAESHFAELSGSFRLSSQQFKAIIYLQNGSVILAASNSARHRLSDSLLAAGKITRQIISEALPFQGDRELAQKLLQKGILTKSEIDLAFSNQLKCILEMAFECTEGEWDFSPLARAKSDLACEFDLGEMLLQYSRKLDPNFVSSRILSHNEIFEVNTAAKLSQFLDPQESFILSLIEGASSFEEISGKCSLPAVMISPSLYILWLGGFLKRSNFKKAFSDEQLARLKSSSFHLTEKAIPIKVSPENTVAEQIEEKLSGDVIPEAEAKTEEYTMEEYLQLLEGEKDYYRTLGLTQKADISEIKRVYFQMAKQFHPDKFHNEEEGLRKRLQNAFTNLAKAYDTLKHQESRELYDFRLRRRKENEEIEAENQDQTTSNETVEPGIQDKPKLAANYFNKGFDLMMAQEEEQAIAFLANAVSLDPKIARYHAYYGKSLMKNKKFRHQAEQELHTAIKLEPANISFKIMLVEFYIEMELMKRADGELKRLIASHPTNKEALALLDKIANK